MLAAIAVVPIGFLAVYPAFRLTTRSLYRRHPAFADLAGPWLPGVVVTAVLAAAGKLIAVLPDLIGR